MSETTLAKHVFLDVVGFTKDRSVEAQTDVIAALNRLVSSAIEQLEIPESNLVMLPTGDGLCVAILGMLDPYDIHLQLAKKIVQSVAHNNSVVESASRTFQVRTGVNENVDNVVQDINGKRNVAGTGINMAQRIMNCADGGQILVGQTVHELLRAREAYEGRFRQFTATGKHDIRFSVYQYLDNETPGLNTELPTIFVPTAKVAPPLSNAQAYYFAYSWLNADFLLSRKDDPEHSYVSVVLLHFLAQDAVARSEAGKYGSAYEQTWGAGDLSFEGQYDYYKANDFGVNVALADLIRRVYLSDLTYCFEKGDFAMTNFAFLNETGRTKLRTERPTICEELGLPG